MVISGTEGPIAAVLTGTNRYGGFQWFQVWSVASLQLM